VTEKPKREVEVQEVEGLSEEELEAQTGEGLPDREEMSLVDANAVIPANVSAALNVASEDAVAYSNAEQNVDIDQSNQ
jgi:hypothetical protein